jgi:hypothetical protein
MINRGVTILCHNNMFTQMQLIFCMIGVVYGLCAPVLHKSVLTPQCLSGLKQLRAE